MRPKMSFSTCGLRRFFMTLSPQKVKNMVTLPPVAAAPLASTNVAMARSRLSLNIMNVLSRLSPAAGVTALAHASRFSITTV